MCITISIEVESASVGSTRIVGISITIIIKGSITCFCCSRIYRAACVITVLVIGNKARDGITRGLSIALISKPICIAIGIPCNSIRCSGFVYCSITVIVYVITNFCCSGIDAYIAIVTVWVGGITCGEAIAVCIYVATELSIAV